MLYLEEFLLLTRQQEESYFASSSRARLNCYTSSYPFGVFRYREVPAFTFSPITIFYGGNGSGKSTLLNIIAEKLKVSRGAVYNHSDFFPDYVQRCEHRCAPGQTIPDESKIITSDDVFDYMLDLRCINAGINTERAKLLEDYGNYRYAEYKLTSLEDYDEWRRHADAKEKKPNISKYVRTHIMNNVRTRSNGESPLAYFTESIKENALYILDEPENSLSAKLQLELKKFLEDSARFFGCQFILSTHSPFLLAIPEATVYDLDSTPPKQRKWTDLDNIRLYHDFFSDHSQEFSQYL